MASSSMRSVPVFGNSAVDPSSPLHDRFGDDPDGNHHLLCMHCVHCNKHYSAEDSRRSFVVEVEEAVVGR